VLTDLVQYRLILKPDVKPKYQKPYEFERLVVIPITLIKDLRKFKDIKGIIRSSKSKKDRQYNEESTPVYIPPMIYIEIIKIMKNPNHKSQK